MGRKTKMNSITSPELLAQVNKKNKDLLEDFLDYMKSIQRSDGTISGYRSDIEICFVWALLYNDNLFYCDWTKRHIIKLQNWLINDNGNSPARVRRIKSSLSSLSNYIENILDDEFPSFRNIIKKIESPVNNPVREKTILSDNDIQEILDKLVEMKRYDLACFTALAAFGGRRKAELCRFRVSDFGDDHLVCGGSLYKSDPIRSKGKGREGRLINCYTLSYKFKPYFDMWMNYRNSNNIESKWLFPDKANYVEPIKISTVNSWMKTLSRISRKDIYAHSFRHYFTTMLSNQGLPDNVIKEVISWKSIDMVSVYIDRDADDTLEMYFDKNGIKSRSKSLSDL